MNEKLLYGPEKFPGLSRNGHLGTTTNLEKNRTVFNVALPFHHNWAPYETFCYGAQAVGSSESHEISHIRRRYSQLLSPVIL